MQRTAQARRSSWIANACAIAATAVALAGGLHAALGQSGGAAVELPLPARLSDTGLYVAGSTTEVDPRNLLFVPQYPLWTDGALKRRWIRLPEGTSIDARDPDAWLFPAGTRLWKEFSFGQRVETRYIERLPSGGFRFATYVWAEDGRDAFLQPNGQTVELAHGQKHDVPRESDCRACHEGRSARVLGFSALQLSTDRDPNAPHREALPKDALDLKQLEQRGLLAHLPETAPPRIAARNPRERAALGYLYGNCSHCHNPRSPIAAVGLDLDQRIASDKPLPALLNTLPHRMGSRFAATQMPPLGTRLVDDEALELVRTWISKDLAEVAKQERDRP
jgi:mono/diheme cytochrome c family protein